MQNIPAIAKKLLIASCEYHENSEANQMWVPVEDVVKLYYEKETELSEKVIQTAFQYLLDKELIRLVKKDALGQSVAIFQITALGFDEANRTS